MVPLVSGLRKPQVESMYCKLEEEVSELQDGVRELGERKIEVLYVAQRVGFQTAVEALRLGTILGRVSLKFERRAGLV